MVTMLLDESKFECLGSVNEFDITTQNETKLQHRLLQLVKKHRLQLDDLPKTVYEVIRFIRSQRLRMYGLPKIHKKDVLIPCRSIVSMIGSAQQELAKFLVASLQIVLELYSTNCTNDFFSFPKMIQQLEVNLNDSIPCSFDICSSFIMYLSGNH